MSEDGVGIPHEPGDDFSKIVGVVVGIVCGRRNVFTVTMAAKVEEHAAELDELPGYEPPQQTIGVVGLPKLPLPVQILTLLYRFQDGNLALVGLPRLVPAREDCPEQADDRNDDRTRVLDGSKECVHVELRLQRLSVSLGLTSGIRRCRRRSPACGR